MQKYEDAVSKATAALQLDKRHQKSLLRRAKAIFYGAERLQALNSMVADQASEDLRMIIAMKGDGIGDAMALLNEIDAKLSAQSVPAQQ